MLKNKSHPPPKFSLMTDQVVTEYLQVVLRDIHLLNAQTLVFLRTAHASSSQSTTLQLVYVDSTLLVIPARLTNFESGYAYNISQSLCNHFPSSQTLFQVLVLCLPILGLVRALSKDSRMLGWRFLIFTIIDHLVAKHSRYLKVSAHAIEVCPSAHTRISLAGKTMAREILENWSLCLVH